MMKCRLCGSEPKIVEACDFAYFTGCTGDCDEATWYYTEKLSAKIAWNFRQIFLRTFNVDVFLISLFAAVCALTVIFIGG